MIFTSYIHKTKDISQLGITPISIAQGKPGGLKILSYKKLAPPWSLIKEYKQTGDKDQYTRIYLESVLNKLNQFQVIADLILLASSPNIALLCYETPEKFCHRHLVAQWLNTALPEEEEVKELEV